MANTGIRLIVGLGNPGAEYANTRHNAGEWFVEALASANQVGLTRNNKCFGQVGQFSLDHNKARLLIPDEYMNLSGKAVQATCHYFDIPVESVLIAHDELDLPVGSIKLKFGGGHGGHNGLRDIHQHLGTDRYHRLRIGIGHPGQRHRVHNYVLSPPSGADVAEIHAAINRGLEVVPQLLGGEIQRAMTALHS